MGSKQFSEQVKALAHALGVSFATVNRWENGKTNPSKLAQVTFDNFREKMRAQGRLGHV